MKLLVLAGGKASRLSKYTKDRIPKLLLSLGNELFIDRLINHYSSVTGNGGDCHKFYFVFSEYSYLQQVKNHLLARGVDAEYIYYPKTDGTYNTLCHAFTCYPELKKETILTWSDIIPEGNYSTPGANEVDIICDKDPRHRYGFDGEKIIPKPEANGNIAGLYILNDVTRQGWEPASVSDELDLVEFLEDSDVRLGGIYTEFFDIGDCLKYETAMASADLTTRWFNDHEVRDGKFHKRSLNAYGRTVMSNEAEYLNHIKYMGISNFPLVYSADKNEIVLEDLSDSHVTLHEYINMTNDYSIVGNVFTALNTIKSETSEPKSCYADAIKEYYHVPFQRLNKIAYALDDKKLEKAFAIKDRLYDYITSKTYVSSLIHGDPNSSNIMINLSDKSVKFIDPRGVFGDTKLYGDSNYDLAKVVYGVTGYSKFNNDPLFHEQYLPCDIDLLDSLCTDPHIKILVGVIWLKLPYYIKNNLVKANAAYEQGIRILEEYLP